MFDKELPKYGPGRVRGLAYIECEANCITFRATIHNDPDIGSPEDNDEGFWPSLDRNSPGWIGDHPSRSYEDQMTDCKAVMARWKAGRMVYCGVVITASKAGMPETGREDHERLSVLY